MYFEYRQYIYQIELRNCRGAGSRTNDWVLKVNYW